MVYSYSVKNDRKYPYYVCRQARQKGWAKCPSKSLPAQRLEESVLGRLREAQGGGWEVSAWEQLDRIQQMGALRAAVERIGYEGQQQRVSIQFRDREEENGGCEHA